MRTRQKRAGGPGAEDLASANKPQTVRPAVQWARRLDGTGRMGLGVRRDDEQLYEIAARELEASAPRKGLFAQAFAEAMGDEAKTKALYLRLRVAQLRAQQEGERREDCSATLESPAACVKALREMGCSVGADATRSWTVVAPDGSPTRVFSFKGLQKHTLAMRSRAVGATAARAAHVPAPRGRRPPPSPDAGETDPAEATSDSRPPADTR